MPRRVVSWTLLFVSAASILCATSGRTTTRLEVSVDDLAVPAARVFRGRCVSATAGVVRLAGGTLPATTYTFEVAEYLKGSGPTVFSFRQIGTQAPLANDLGRLAGLPVYAPGFEYVLFLLPTSRAGLASPTGAGLGALRMEGERWVPMTGAIRGIDAQSDRAGVPSMRYESIRRAVREGSR